MTESKLHRARLLADLVPGKPGDPASPGWGGIESDQLATELLNSRDAHARMAIAVANLLLAHVDEAGRRSGIELKPSRMEELAHQALDARDAAEKERDTLRTEVNRLNAELFEMKQQQPYRDEEMRQAGRAERDGEVAKLEAKFAADAAAHDSTEEDA